LSSPDTQCYIEPLSGAPAASAQPNMMEAILLRPLPPFRAKPSRKLLAPKLPSEARKESIEISVKARRHPVKLARLQAAPSLKVLNPPDANLA
jgi:hypothetical protein